jgi:hypothetical protein
MWHSGIDLHREIAVTAVVNDAGECSALAAPGLRRLAAVATGAGRRDRCAISGPWQGIPGCDGGRTRMATLDATLSGEREGRAERVLWAGRQASSANLY